MAQLRELAEFMQSKIPPLNERKETDHILLTGDFNVIAEDKNNEFGEYREGWEYRAMLEALGGQDDAWGGIGIVDLLKKENNGSHPKTWWPWVNLVYKPVGGSWPLSEIHPQRLDYMFVQKSDKSFVNTTVQEFIVKGQRFKQLSGKNYS